MRVADLDRDMRDVIPTGVSVDSEYLYARMTDLTLELADPRPGRRVLDVASGLGADALRLAERGAEVVGLEPSARMLALARLGEERAGASGNGGPGWVQGWADGLPFADDSFDAAVCKGSLDHFDRPDRAVAEMARVVRPEGRVVLAIANFESLAFRLSRALDDWRERSGLRPIRAGRRLYDVPSDHFTRYDLGLMQEQAGRALQLDQVLGVSLVWGFPGWSGAVGRLPRRAARWTLQRLDAAARRLPALADVVVLAGRPRSAIASR